MPNINVSVKLSWSPWVFNTLTALAVIIFAAWLVVHGAFPWYLALVPFLVPIAILAFMAALFTIGGFFIALFGGR